MSDYQLLIDGKLVPGDQTMPVINPATEEVLAQCPRASKAQLDQAVAAAKAAFPAWARDPDGGAPQARDRDRRRHRGQCGRTGAPADRSRASRSATPPARFCGAAAFFRYFASLDLPVKVLEDTATARSKRIAGRWASSARSSRGTSR